MQQPETYITAHELFERVADVLQKAGTGQPYINKTLHDVLVLTCTAGLRHTPYGFGDLHAQVNYLCTERRITQSDVHDIHRMRRNSNRAVPLSTEEALYDARALAIFVSAVFREAIPAFLVGKFPVHGRQIHKGLRLDTRYIRCIVQQWDDDFIQVRPDQDTDNPTVRVAYRSEQQFADMTYLRTVLREGMQLNLLDCQLKGDTVTPRLIVVEPDYLIDISSLAACFTEFGHHAALFTLNRMKLRTNTYHTLLGNFAGRALDRIIHSPDSSTFSMSETLKANFRERALEYATCTDLDPAKFKREAEEQIRNMQQIVAELFKTYDRNRAVLEPSFVCEQLGLQGRVDMMTADFKLLVEQKSGKNVNLERHCRNRHGNHHIEAHYVQALLYDGILRYNFRLTSKATQIFLLYSKYALPTGLLDVARLDMLTHEALKLRNLIVANDLRGSIEGVEEMIGQLDPQILNTEKIDGFFYRQYLLPAIESITAPLNEMTALEKAYFYRMLQFVLKEQLIAKTGSIDSNGHSNADLWNMPLSEKKEMGNIYTDLKIVRKESARGQGYDTIVLDVPDQGEDFLPNFRRGDMVYLYGYHPAHQPDVRHSILFKGFMQEIGAREIAIHLINAQQNDEILHIEKTPLRRQRVYAVEHSASDVGGSNAIQALHTLITTPRARKDLLLGQRAPQCDPNRTLTRSYHPDYDEVLLKAKQAIDYFLLVGPPGTGKTSMALRFMIEEELASAASSVLLMAYTNRAVDEICGMLCNARIRFVRLGNEHSCDPSFRPYLLDQLVTDNPKLNDLRDQLENTQVIVGTTSMIASKPFVFAVKHFSLAIVDEASQILEPHIIGLLASHTATDSAGTTTNPQPDIDKFILIGDYKQLPAVVQQSPADSKVHEPELRSIALTDCRNSLFERLIHWENQQGRDRFIGILRKQGRMHPAIAAFPNRMFYFKEQLEPVPLQHQVDTDLGYCRPAADATDELLLKQRLIFYSSEFCRQPHLSDKVNTDEARKVADLLRRIHRLCGEKFDPQKTVGIIVPYRNQIAMIRKEIDRFELPDLQQVCIDTVERYQGSQRDVIIYSFTVQNRYQLDFLTANSLVEDNRLIDRKLNVAITRARKQLIMLGNRKILSCNPLFKQLIDETPCHLS